jgi:hypothetical protein
MNTDKPQPEEKKPRSMMRTIVGAAGLAAATYAAKNPEKVVRVAKKVFKVGQTALGKVVKTQKAISKRTR